MFEAIGILILVFHLMCLQPLLPYLPVGLGRKRRILTPERLQRIEIKIDVWPIIMLQDLSNLKNQFINLVLQFMFAMKLFITSTWLMI